MALEDRSSQGVCCLYVNQSGRPLPPGPHALLSSCNKRDSAPGPLHFDCLRRKACVCIKKVKSDNTPRNHTVTCIPEYTPLYLLCILDVATAACIRDPHACGPPAAKKIVNTSLAQSASVNACLLSNTPTEFDAHNHSSTHIWW